jgi:hypothetical protein
VRKRLAAALTIPFLLAAPGTASADVIFDPADADDLAASLAEAYTDQNVCYGWQVTVNDVSTTDKSVGSNFGAGKPVTDGSCDKTVEFQATITYTSESSEAEDSASYDVTSTPPGVTRDDLDALGIDFDGLTGEDPDVAIGKAVVALPLLAADKGLADPLAATPDNATPAADAQLTDDPDSDWWRDRGGMLLWGVGLLLAGGLFVWWVLKTNRRTKRLASFPAAEPTPIVPDSVPPEWSMPPADHPTSAPPPYEPPTEPFQKPDPTKPAAEGPPASTKDPAAGPHPAQAHSPSPPQPAQKPDAVDESATDFERETPPSSAVEGSRAEPSSGESAVPEEPTDSTKDSEAGAAAEGSAASTPRVAEPPPDEPASDEPATSTKEPEQARPAPSDRKDKE